MITFMMSAAGTGPVIATWRELDTPHRPRATGPGVTARARDGLLVRPRGTGTVAPDPERWRIAAAGNPDCAPVINALAPPSGPYTEHNHISGGSAGDVLRTRITALPGTEARGRFDALRDAVHGGRCTTLRLSAEAVAFALEPMPVDGLDVPTVGFRLRSTGGTVLLALYAAVGENALLFSVGDEATRKPALRTDLVTAQVKRVLATA